MAETDYKSTLALPKTAFPMKANLAKREPETLKRWDEMGLYARLMEERKDKPLWVLHDGPPYATGRVHLGDGAQQDSQGFRGAVALDARLSDAVRSRMGLSRDADRAQGLARTGREGPRDEQA